MKKVELKSCPFCGINPILCNKLVTELLGIHTEYYIQCPGCLVKSCQYLKEENAIEKWNTRANDERN